MIAFSKPPTSDYDVGSTFILGILLAFLLAWGGSIIAVCNRMMSDLDWFVILFCHSVLGFSTALLYVSIEAIFKQDYRLFTAYTGRQYAIIAAISCIDFVCLISIVIAQQSCELGFISMFGYLYVVWSFLADIFVFHETFNSVEMIGAALIMAVTVTVAFVKLYNEKK